MTSVSFACPFFSSLSKQLADGLVEPLAHRPVARDVDRLGLVLVLVEETLGRVVRRVRHHRRVPDEERLAVLLRLVEEVEDRLQSFATDLEALVAVTAALRGIAVRHPFGKPAATARVAFPPLPRLEAQVTFLLQESRQRRRLLEQRDHLLPLLQVTSVFVRLRRGHSFRERRVVRGDLVLMRIEAGDHRREARPAQTARHVAAFEEQPFRRELVEMRRLDVLVAHEAVVGPALIVTDDEEHIRRARLRRQCECECERERREENPHR